MSFITMIPSSSSFIGVDSIARKTALRAVNPEISYLSMNNENFPVLCKYHSFENSPIRKFLWQLNFFSAPKAALRIMSDVVSSFSIVSKSVRAWKLHHSKCELASRLISPVEFITLLLLIVNEIWNLTVKVFAGGFKYCSTRLADRIRIAVVFDLQISIGFEMKQVCEFQFWPSMFGIFPWFNSNSVYLDYIPTLSIGY